MAQSLDPKYISNYCCPCQLLPRLLCQISPQTFFFSVVDSTQWTDGFFLSGSLVGCKRRFVWLKYLTVIVFFAELICFHMISSLNCFASCLWHMTVEVICWWYFVNLKYRQQLESPMETKPTIKDCKLSHVISFTRFLGPLVVHNKVTEYLAFGNLTLTLVQSSVANRNRLV